MNLVDIGTQTKTQTLIYLIFNSKICTWRKVSTSIDMVAVLFRTVTFKLTLQTIIWKTAFFITQSSKITNFATWKKYAQHSIFGVPKKVNSTRVKKNQMNVLRYCKPFWFQDRVDPKMNWYIIAGGFKGSNIRTGDPVIQ